MVRVTFDDIFRRKLSTYIYIISGWHFHPPTTCHKAQETCKYIYKKKTKMLNWNFSGWIQKKKDFLLQRVRGKGAFWDFPRIRIPFAQQFSIAIRPSSILAGRFSTAGPKVDSSFVCFKELSVLFSPKKGEKKEAINHSIWPRTVIDGWRVTFFLVMLLLLLLG